jgi:hypothetical protein
MGVMAASVHQKPVSPANPVMSKQEIVTTIAAGSRYAAMAHAAAVPAATAHAAAKGWSAATEPAVRTDAVNLKPQNLLA